MPTRTMRLPAKYRSPRRISITIPYHVASNLQTRCDEEGRSLSNLAAFLLECSLDESHDK